MVSVKDNVAEKPKILFYHYFINNSAKEYF